MGGNRDCHSPAQSCKLFIKRPRLEEEGGKGKRREMRNARLKVQNCLLRPKAEVYIHIRLHNIYNMEAATR